MNLHESIRVGQEGLKEIIRVPGGWIYVTYYNGGGHISTSSTFIPFNNEFQKLWNDDVT